MKVLVYGGTGSQAGATVWKLLEAGHTPVIVTRNPEKAAKLVEAGAQTVNADMEDAAALRTASEQVDAVALMVPAFVPNPMLQPTYFRNAVDAAKAAGNKYVVYNTSGTVINVRTGHPMYDMRLELIEYLAASGVPYVTIEPTAYMENLLGPWTRPNVAAHDTLTYPVDENTPIGWIATEDVGALVAAALARPELANRRIPVSGLVNLTGPELAAAFTRGLGRTITYREMSLDEFGAALDMAFGPGAGEGGKQGYKFQRENKDLLTMWVDMQPVLELLPIQMTSAETWARKFAMAFANSPMPQAQP